MFVKTDLIGNQRPIQSGGLFTEYGLTARPDLRHINFPADKQCILYIVPIKQRIYSVGASVLVNSSYLGVSSIKCIQMLFCT
jgi:hypothetical protein